MEQILINYLANATWQIPLLAGGAWLFIRIGKFDPRTQHGIWLAVLVLAIGLPLRGARPNLPPATHPTCAACTADNSPILDREALPRAAILTQFVVGDPRLPRELFAPPHLNVRLSPTVTKWLIGFYFAFSIFGLYRILAALRRARQLVIDADLTTLAPQWNAIFLDSGRYLGVRLPQMRTTAEVRSPVIVGVRQPVLLLPEDFGNHSQNEVQAALLHELAHVRRQDYLSNLLCQLAALPIAWHPLTHGVQQRIRRTREMVCDDIAARAMHSHIGYARCLLAMAGRTLGQPGSIDTAQAIGLFGDNVLEERIMRLMQEKNTMTMRTRLVRIASGAIAMILATVVAASFHVTPTLAQTTDDPVTAPAPAAPPIHATPPDISATPLPPTPPAPDRSVAPPAPEVPATPTSRDTSPTPPIPAAPILPEASASPVVPVAPAVPDAAIAPTAPVPPPASEPDDAKPSSTKKKVTGHRPKDVGDKSFVIDTKDKPFVVDLNENHALTAEQQSRLQKEMAVADAQIAVATRRLNSAEFKHQMARMQHEIDAATAKVNSPEFKKQMADLQKQIESGAMQRSMEEASKQMNLAEQQQSANQKLDMAKMQQEIDAATAKINSPEFRQQIENLQKQMESSAMQRSMEEASKQLKAVEDRMRQQQTNQQQTK